VQQRLLLRILYAFLQAASRGVSLRRRQVRLHPAVDRVADLAVAILGRVQPVVEAVALDLRSGVPR